MQKIVLTIKDEGKLTFFLELLKQFDFVEVQQLSVKTDAIAEDETYDFFASAGLWKNRNIEAKYLREKAWKHRQ